MKNISTAIADIKRAYDTQIQIVDGLYFRQKDVIRNIEFYSNSKYLNGQDDEQKREKPFYNILNAICDVENAAKDIDTKDITATSDDGNHYLKSFLLSKDIYEWMKRVNFAKTLNDMRDTHTRYGSLLVKKVKKDGQVTIEIPDWKNLITDQVDIINNPIIEIHYLTAQELLQKEQWKNVDDIAEKAIKGGFSNRIPVYEVRGKFPLSYFNEVDGKTPSEKDKKTFTYQLYYMAGEPSSQPTGEVSAINWDDTVNTLTPLYWENDTDEVYKYLTRKRKAGRGFGVGVFEEGEQAQVWTNDAILKQARAMEFTSKSVSQTASRKLKGRNMLSEVDDGTILEIEDNKPILPVNLLPSGGLNQYQNLLTQWYDQLQKTTSAYSAQRGDTPPSGTPFRLQATVLQQSNSVFKNLQEELGIFVTEIFEDWILPDLAKQLNKEHILSHNFTLEELEEIDGNFSTYTANQEAKRRMLSGKLVTIDEYEAFREQAKESLKLTKGSRFLEIPKDFYKDVNAKITINVTGEQWNKAAVLESLSSIMTIYASNPAISSDPVLTHLLMKIVELSGANISPVTFASAIKESREKQEEMAQMAQQQAMQEASPEAPQAPQEGLSLAANPMGQL